MAGQASSSQLPGRRLRALREGLHYDLKQTLVPEGYEVSAICPLMGQRVCGKMCPAQVPVLGGACSSVFAPVQVFRTSFQDLPEQYHLSLYELYKQERTA